MIRSWTLSLLAVVFILHLAKLSESRDIFEDVTDESKYPCNYSIMDHARPITSKVGRRVSDIKCEEYSWEYWANEQYEVRSQECLNFLSGNDQSATVLDRKQKRAEFPHVGAVGWKLPNGELKFMCTSALISPKFALTAAHCQQMRFPIDVDILRLEPHLVRFGLSYAHGEESEDSSSVYDALIENFHVPYEYSIPLKYNDIGLIELKENIAVELNLRPACLLNEVLPSSWHGNLTGIKFREPVSYQLKNVQVDYINQDACKTYINRRRNRHFAQGIVDHQFCAGTPSDFSGTCQVASGSPLQMRKVMPMGISGETDYVVGVLSFGVACNMTQLPEIFTKVNSFSCWIERTVWPEERNDFCPPLVANSHK